MAQKTDIRLRRSDTAGKIPTSANLSDGELAINTGSGALYFKKSDGTIITAHDNTILHIDSDTTGSSTTGTNPKVGIGTTSPDEQLHISNALPAVIRLERNDTTISSGNTIGNIEFEHQESGGEGLCANFAVKADTGAGAGAFVFETGAAGTLTEKVRFTSGGNVGIGTTSPSVPSGGGLTIYNSTIPRINFKNSTTGDGSTDGLEIYINGLNALVNNREAGSLSFGTSNITRAIIDSSGNVGIGTTSPGNLLEVAGATPIVEINSTSGSPELQFSDGGVDEFSIQYDTGANGLKFVEGGVGTRVTILDGGNVGIGTSSPSEKLHISGSSNTTARIITTSTAFAADYAALSLVGGDNEASIRSIHGGSGAGALAFFNENAERLRIDSSGNVGIGTTSPDATLELSNAFNAPTLRISNESNIVAAGGDLGVIEFYSGDNSNSGDSVQASLSVIQPTTDNVSGEFVFKTSNAVENSGALTERLRIAKDGAITFNNAFTFPTSIGTTGQVLKVPSTGSTLVWADDTGGSGSADSLTDLDGDTKIQVEESADEDVIRFDVAGLEIATMTDDGVILNDGYNFEGDIIGATKFKAQAGEALTIGDVVYISGISGNTVIVSKADANDSAKMPAFGLAGSTVSLNAAVEIVTFGTLLGVDTSTPSFALGEELYVSTTAGELTNSAPTGSSSLIQKIGKVTRVDASAGSIKVMGAGRTNATPNLDEGRLFVGNSSNQSVQSDDTLYVDMANSRVGIGTTSPSEELTIRASVPKIQIEDSDGTNQYGQFYHSAGTTSILARNNTTDGTIVFQKYDGTTTDETMRIDSSGNLLVGTTDNNVTNNTGNNPGINIGVAGIKGYIAAARYQGAPLALNRLSNDGDIIGFQKDGSTVGSISTKNGEFSIGNGDTGILFNETVNAIYPWNVSTNDGSDGSLDLGLSTRRWKDVYLSGVLYGPATFTIDPAAHGDNTGTVVIAGNLQVDGTTTTINSTTLTVDDKLITLASGSANAAAANGAGIEVEISGATNPSLTYDGTNDEWDFNKDINVTGTVTADGLTVDGNGSLLTFNNGSNPATISNTNGNITTDFDTTNAGRNYTIQANSINAFRIATGGDISFYEDTGTTAKFFWDASAESLAITGANNTWTLSNTTLYGNRAAQIYIGASDAAGQLAFVSGGSERMRINSSGNVGIGTTSPDVKLHLEDASRVDIKFEKTGSETHYIRKDGNFLRFRGHDDSTVLFELKNNTDGSNAASFPNGNLGIGTTLPNAKLNISDATAPTFRLSRTGTGQIWQQSIDSSGRFILQEAASEGGTKYTRLAIDDDGNVGIGTSSPSAKLQVEEYGIDTTETSTTATTQVAIHTFAATDFRSARFTIQASNSTDSTYHISEILLVHDGTTPTITEYGTIFTGSAAEATFDADISSGNVRLLATPASTDSIEFKVICHSVTI